jgi:hypothetical protein
MTLSITINTNSVSNTRLVQSVYCQQASGSGSETCLAAPTTAGTLLTAVEFDFNNSTGVPATPANWKLDCSETDGSHGRLTFFSYPNNPGGITSAVFTPASGPSTAVVAEWSGMSASSPFDGCGPFGSNGSNGPYFTSGAVMASQTDLAIGGVLAQFNDNFVFTPGEGWTPLLNAPQTHVGAQGWTAYIENGAASPYTFLGTANVSTGFYAAVATYKSVVAGSVPSGNLASSFTDFETSTNGTTLTTPIMDTATHGSGVSHWTVDSGYKISTSAQMTAHSPTTVNGITYSGSGTRGLAEDLTVSGDIKNTFPESAPKASAFTYFTTGTDIVDYLSYFCIGGDNGNDFACFTVNFQGQIELECKTGEDWLVSPMTLAAINTKYAIALQYVAGGRHTLKVYGTPGTTPTLLGTASCPATGTNNAIDVIVGNSHGVPGTGTVFFDNVMWDTSAGNLMVP